MSGSEAENVHPIVPPDEIRCVWMTAGVLSYQLCERKLDCEYCPLDSALRQTFINQQVLHGQNRPVIEPPAAKQSHRNMLYGRRHMWVSSLDDHTTRLGLEPGLTSVLISPKAVVLPSIGDRVVRNKVCAWIVLDGGTLPIASPISGKVSGSNAYLAENPHAICSSPLDQGWLFDIVTDGPIVRDADLLALSDAALVYAEDQKRFQAMLSAELSKADADIGLTMADGGEALESLSEMLGPSKYFKLVKNAYT